MFAALAQHLCAALVPLDVGATHGALLDGHVSVAIRAHPVYQDDSRGHTSGLSRELLSKDMRASLVSRQSEEKSLFSGKARGRHSL